MHELSEKYDDIGESRYVLWQKNIAKLLILFLNQWAERFPKEHDSRSFAFALAKQQEVRFQTIRKKQVAKEERRFFLTEDEALREANQYAWPNLLYFNDCTLRLVYAILMEHSIEDIKREFFNSPTLPVASPVLASASRPIRSRRLGLFVLDSESLIRHRVSQCHEYNSLMTLSALPATELEWNALLGKRSSFVLCQERIYFVNVNQNNVFIVRLGLSQDKYDAVKTIFPEEYRNIKQASLDEQRLLASLGYLCREKMNDYSDFLILCLFSETLLDKDCDLLRGFALSMPLLIKITASKFKENISNFAEMPWVLLRVQQRMVELKERAILSETFLLNLQWIFFESILNLLKDKSLKERVSILLQNCFALLQPVINQDFMRKFLQRNFGGSLYGHDSHSFYFFMTLLPQFIRWAQAETGLETSEVPTSFLWKEVIVACLNCGQKDNLNEMIKTFDPDTQEKARRCITGVVLPSRLSFKP